MPRPRDEHLRGTISAFGLASGDRIVIGAWRSAPGGAFADVMWARPDDGRLLLAPDDRAARYVAGIYLFDQIEVVPFTWAATPATLSLRAGPLEADLVAGGGMRVPVARPWWFTRRVEGPIARRLLGVEVHGTSPRGAEEWYQARAWRWVREATVRVDGEDQGEVGPPTPALGVGFSEPPPRASITDVAVRIRRPRRRPAPARSPPEPGRPHRRPR